MLIGTGSDVLAAAAQQPIAREAFTSPPSNRSGLLFRLRARQASTSPLTGIVVAAGPKALTPTPLPWPGLSRLLTVAGSAISPQGPAILSDAGAAVSITTLCSDLLA